MHSKRKLTRSQHLRRKQYTAWRIFALMLILLLGLITMRACTTDVGVVETPAISIPEPTPELTPEPTPEPAPEPIEIPTSLDPWPTEEQLEAMLVHYDCPTVDHLIAYFAEKEQHDRRIEEYVTNYDLLLRVVIAEAGNQGYDGMHAVAQTIWCRTYDTPYNFGDSLYEVITAKNQFAPPYPYDTAPFEPDASAALDAVFYEQDFFWDTPVHYFYVNSGISDASRNWFETKTYVGVHGAHTFRSEYK